ncbi:MAG: OmpA family protein [Muribaculaceae bacterium]|nr:OmpA family protein [Muribaculaceae bacterium]
MWDLTNSIGGIDLDRPVSVIPFVGIGGTYNWHFNNQTEVPKARGRDGVERTNVWQVPVSAGLQIRFRLCKYVDLFLEGRTQFAGDNYNLVTEGHPIDVNFRGTAGVTFNIGGRSFTEYDPCAYDAYIADLNSQVNDLRGELAATGAALAAAEAQLPCPEVVTQVTETVVQPAPLMSTVRFSINSAKVNAMEMVNVYNVAQYMKANPDSKITITGYADKDTGSTGYNQKLSERRAQAVYDILVNNYGSSADRLSTAAEGSSVQPYDTNNWNRIVIFSTPE